MKLLKFRKVIGYVGLAIGLVSIVVGIILLRGGLFEGGLLFTLVGYTLLTVDRMEETVAAVLEEAKATRRSVGRVVYLVERSQASSAREQEEEVSGPQ